MASIQTRARLSAKATNARRSRTVVPAIRAQAAKEKIKIGINGE